MVSHEEAGRQSKHCKAVGSIIGIHQGMSQELEVIKPLGRDAFVYLPKIGIPLRKATNKEVDSVKRWKPFQ